MQTVVEDKYRGTVKYDVAKAKLIEAAQRHGFVRYQEIALAVGLPTSGNYMGKEVGHLLGEISEDEHRNGRPMLSAVAVHTQELRQHRPQPGSGFFDLASELGVFDPAQQDSETFFREQLNQVYETWMP